MTMIDLQNFELKRSVHPVHYVFMFHSLISTHMADFPNSYDHYDTILCAGPHQAREICKREELHGLKAKQLIPHGYHRLEQLMAQRRRPPPVVADRDIHVLLAPSWGEHTILNVCGLELMEKLLAAGFTVTLRPHYQTRWKTPEVIDRITRRFGSDPRLRVVEDMGESSSLFDSHVMITDWSGAGQDYGMALEKPVLYIDVPRKARNDVWPELGMEPFEALVRDKIGAILAPTQLDGAPAAIRELLRNPDQFSRNVARLRDEWVYNLGSSAAAGAQALQRTLRTL
jgi:CDP-Glycerol:Poly(glycerophosphate) glycerophosphotransferase